MSNLVVIGQGYVGLPMALRAAEVGHKVLGLDLNASVIDALNAGISHIGDISNDELAAGIAAGYSATTDQSVISQADVVVVCVPTPLSADGGPDLSAVEATARSIGNYVTRNTLCILESTTYPGTTEEVFAPLVMSGGLEIGKDIQIAFSPERIDPGNEHYGVKNTPKVVGGLTAECTESARDFYASFIDTVVTARSAKEAEMAKLLENTFRHVNIALVNEMVRFCEELGIDLWDSIDAASTKPFGFMAFRPGPGVGGHCIPIDPSYLSHRVKAKLGYAFRMVELAEEINHAAPKYVVQRIVRMLNENKASVSGAKILLVGVTYKANVADQRESPAIPIADELLEWGAELSYYDPFVPEWSVRGTNGDRLVSARDIVMEASQSDLVVLLQNHAVVDLRALLDAAPRLLDTRGVCPAHKAVSRL